MERKRRHHEALAGNVAQSERAPRELETELDSVTGELNRKVDERERLEQEVADRLQRDDAFQRLSDEALRAEGRLSRNEERLEEIRRESAEHLPAYEQSTLFQYLYACGYGTTAYRHRGLTRRLDRRVAGLIDFARARQSYDFLRTTAELMTQELERRREEFETLMERIEDLEQETADRAGLTDVLRGGEKLGARRDDLVGKIANEVERRERLQAQSAALEQQQAGYYRQALERFEEFLGSTRAAALEQRASTRPETRDDRIVAEISDLDRRLGDLRGRLTDLSNRRQRAARTLQDLDRILDDYRHADFDSPRAYFADAFDAEGAVEGFLEGRLSRKELWNQMRRHHALRPS